MHFKTYTCYIVVLSYISNNSIKYNTQRAKLVNAINLYKIPQLLTTPHMTTTSSPIQYIDNKAITSTFLITLWLMCYTHKKRV
jgi:hypothetical protein